MPPPPARTLHLHAGPHKTASTYLQARLQRNRRALERHGLRYPTPWGEHSHRHLARDLQAGHFGALEQFLLQQRRWSGDLLLSAEHFAPLLASPEALAALRTTAAAGGFDLHVISYVRPQSGLLDSCYGHRLARLYGAPGFPAYVRAQLAGRRLSGRHRRRWIRMGPLALDFERRFAPLLADTGLRSNFLPYRSRQQDPFAQLLELLALPQGDWRPAPPSQANEQLGRRGLGLAYLVNRELDTLPIRRNRLIAEHGLNRLVERIRARTRERGWVNDRFSGWGGRLPALLQQQLGASNDRFARHVWGRSWEQVFGPAAAPADAAEAPRGLLLDQELEEEARALVRAYRRRLPAACR
ncbi:hypothetical protein [Cyanobium sp. CH-040]|uniref:hypothetical protein n=1 Tax=Cyanobium sp. CH-040 TaxID=2823708 RepID=UPI0020CBFC0F|nr:hypothetical protein [Cyanobium sp. CH-040]MCP9928295.1 hypothetical protein [Cyanobium sp. CH-040]